MKKVLFILLFNLSFGQNNFNSYNQLIAGKNYKLEMIPISSGNFLMGSPNSEKNRLADEGPQNIVEIETFR